MSEIVGAAGVDLALDPVGGDRLVDSLRLLAPEGRLLVVGFTAGEIPTVKVNRLLLGNIGVLGAASREFFERRPALMGELWTHYLDLRKTGATLEALQRGALQCMASTAEGHGQLNGRYPMSWAFP